MRLAPFILSNLETIVSEWATFASSLTPGKGMAQLALRDASEDILRATAYDMRAGQSLMEQANKSKGHGGAVTCEGADLDHASVVHALERVESGFDIVEVVSEYRALRASVLRLWRVSLPEPSIEDLDDVIRFNESMDQSIAMAVASYTRRVDDSRRMFLAILSHDLRNPLHSIRLAAQTVSVRTGDAQTRRAASLIETSTQAMARLVNDLMDFATTGIGGTMPLKQTPANLAPLCREVLQEFRSANAERELRLALDDDLKGEWDATRLRQVISNLLANAIQHGSAGGAIELSARPEGQEVVVQVRNEGPPLPPERLPTLFNPLVRYPTQEWAAHRDAGSVGLGLYIVREIVQAHGGTVEVVSNDREGTVFTVRLPRMASGAPH